MRTNIIRIGNSQGIRIPKILLEQSQLGPDVELKVKDKQIVIYPAVRPRQDWAKQFQRMAQRGDDTLSDEGKTPPTQWEKDEWEW